MQLDPKVLKTDESVALSLRSLYSGFGYSQYKMSKFEEYALYIRNKDFLVSDGIISFTDTNGRLLALKPDVTLSIINNSKDVEGQVQKLYYDENVYRISGSTHSYKEIKQTGLECIGDVGFNEICEVILLAIRSLESISNRFVFELSHVGIMETVFKELELSGETKKTVLSCINSKNEDDLFKLVKEEKLTLANAKILTVFMKNFVSFEEAVSSLKDFCGEECTQQLKEFEDILLFLKEFGFERKIKVDFSSANTMSYYSGVAFSGYVEGIPTRVISGGRYDKLMKKMGRSSGAIGFAVYLDNLERYNFEQKEFDVDVLLLHSGNTVMALKTAEEFSKGGETVRVCSFIPNGLTYRRLVKLEDFLEGEGK